MVDEKHGFMSSVLATHGDRLRPVAYFSTKLDAVAAGLPHCLRAVAAAELAVLASREFVGYSDLTLMVPHAVSMILQDRNVTFINSPMAEVSQEFGALWKHRIFLKSDGHPILNASLVSELLEAILLPDEVAICKCAAHTDDKSFISTGNARADAAAQETKETTCALVSVTNPDISPCLQSMQTFSTGAENKNGGRLAAASRGVYG